MHLAPGMVDLLLHAAPMHDVGKLGISDNILLKPGPLSAEERQVMNTHASIGAQILAGSTSPVIQMGERVALAHHEKWDGTGYPHRLTREEIPIEARICSVVDFFDALAMDRPYRKAVPKDEVVRMILDAADAHFDPSVVEIFVDVRGDIEAIHAEYFH
ncbi:MAG: HD domain-containing protein [Gemmatimonadetes bacterium]|nr:HD domain-containing protein [Gemmatimonadota bacterium]